MKRKIGNDPFLFDNDDGGLVGVSQPDGVEEYLMLVRTAAGVPVDGAQGTLTTDMTNANADITLTSVGYGYGQNGITIVYVDPSANDQSLFVFTNPTTRLITVSLATSALGAITSTATEVVAALAADTQTAALVTAAAEGTGAGVVNAKTVAPLTGGVTATFGRYPAGEYVNSTTGDRYRKTGAQTWALITGGAPLAYRAVTATDDVEVDDSFIDIDSTAGAIILTLPAVATVPTGKVYYFKATNVTNTITIEGAGTETIDGNLNITMPGLGSSRLLISTGSAWKLW